MPVGIYYRDYGWNFALEYEPPMTGGEFHALFNARSIALLGASKDPRKSGFTMLNSLIKDGFSERIYPVNPKEDEILKGMNGHQ